MAGNAAARRKPFEPALDYCPVCLARLRTYATREAADGIKWRCRRCPAKCYRDRAALCVEAIPSAGTLQVGIPVDQEDAPVVTGNCPDCFVYPAAPGWHHRGDCPRRSGAG